MPRHFIKFKKRLTPTLERNVLDLNIFSFFIVGIHRNLFLFFCPLEDPVSVDRNMSNI